MILRRLGACVLGLALLLPGLAAAEGSDAAGIRQKLADAKAAIDDMNSKLSDAFAAYKEISSAKEVSVEALNCINEKLGAMKGLARLSEQALVLMQEHAAKNELDAAEHQHVKITIAKEKMEGLHSEALSCASGGARHTGETENEVETDEDVEKFNEEKDSGGGGEGGEPPAYEQPQQSSPYN